MFEALEGYSSEVGSRSCKVLKCRSPELDVRIEISTMTEILEGSASLPSSTALAVFVVMIGYTSVGMPVWNCGRCDAVG
jgi:N-acetylmuramic acid 6-phosphate (MurNAc-6-P) etherase